MGKKRMLSAIALSAAALLGFVVPIGDTLPAFATTSVEDQAPAAGTASVDANAAAGDSAPVAGADESGGSDAAVGDSANQGEVVGGAGSDGLGSDQGIAQKQPDVSLDTLLQNSEDAAASLDITPFSVSPDYCVGAVYSLDAGTTTTRSARSFPLDSSASTVTGSLSVNQAANSLNGLAIMPDGSAAYAVERNPTSANGVAANTYRIHRLNPSDNTSTVVSTSAAGSASTNAVVGAINPAGTIYYFGYFNASGTRYLELFAFNLVTESFIGQVGRMQVNSYSFTEGDIAFDQNGSLWVLAGRNNNSNNSLYRFDSVPTTAGTSTYPSAQSVTIGTSNSYAWSGLAFDPQGTLWVQRQANATQSYRQQITLDGLVAGTGAVVTTTNFLANDLASCGLQKRPTITFAVRDAKGDPVGGASALIGGPKNSGNSDNTASNWGSNNSVSVLDCTTVPCASGSIDRDPRPGYFQVEWVADGAPPTYVSSNNRYRLNVDTAPAGYGWDTANAWVTIPASATNGQWPATGAWTWNSAAETNTYAFPDLVVVAFAPVCEPNYVYAISAGGQMQQIVIEPSADTASVKNMGSAANVGDFNGLGISKDGGVAYAYNRVNSSGGSTGNTYYAKIYKYNVATGSWSAATSNTTDAYLDGGVGVAGAVAPDGKYYFGRFDSNTTFSFWVFDGTTGNTSAARQVTNLPNSSNNNGDIAFDGAGNLYLTRGATSGTSLQIFKIPSASLSGTGNVNGSGTSIYNISNAGISGVNGVAFDESGRFYLGGSSTVGYLPMPTPGTGAATAVTFSAGTMSSSDLASCNKPPTVKLQKNLPNGRAAATDQFGLQLRQGGTVSGGTISDGTSLGTATASSPASGVQSQVVGPAFVASGTVVTFAETFQAGADKDNYASGWRCTYPGDIVPPATTPTPVVVGSGSGTAGSITVPAMSKSKEITCEFVNSIVQATKTANPVTSTPVDENGFVTYTLTFDNSAGLGPSVITYRDYLKDVLDDAFFVDAGGNPRPTPLVTFAGGITYTEGTHWSAANQWIDVRGTVVAGATGTLSFRVKMLPNTSNATDRQAATATQGYMLRNKLAKGNSATPPSACTSGLCTEHPVRAWTTYKESRPASNARLHKGGNAHYRIVAQKLTPQTPITNLVFRDDLTAVFYTAGFAPNAAVPGGALRRGIYFFDSAGQSLDAAGANVGTPINPLPAYDENSGYVPAPMWNATDSRWYLTTLAVNVPSNAVRAEMWFAVQAAESPASIPAAWPGTPPANAPKTGDKFTNYMTASAASAPVQCDTAATTPPTIVKNVRDTNFPAACQVTHELSDNYFTVRKDAQGPAVDAVNVKKNALGQTVVTDPAYGADITGMWNMVGQVFEIRDDSSNTPTANPSKYLCRTQYNPNTGWNGVFHLGGANANGTPDWSEGSATLSAIVQWNNTHPTDQRPLCGLFYPQGTFGGQPNAGGQDGRWRSENLPEGTFWMLETKAPSHQISLDGQQTRPVPGIQLLAQPVKFRVWQEADGPTFGPENPKQSMEGRGQLDVAGSSSNRPSTGYQDRCEPGGTVAARPVACVNPTGYLLLMKDPAPTRLPLTGGYWFGPIVLGGGLTLAIALIGIWWWRQRKMLGAPEPIPEPGGDDV